MFYPVCMIIEFYQVLSTSLRSSFHFIIIGENWWEDSFRITSGPSQSFEIKLKVTIYCRDSDQSNT